MCCESLRNYLQEIGRAERISKSHSHTEKGVRIEIDRPAQTQVFKVRLEECEVDNIPPHSKADCLFCICPKERYCIAELKGAGDVPKALKQLKATYLQLRSPLSLNESNTKLVYVSKSVPTGSNLKIQILREQIKRELRITPQPVKSGTVFKL